MKAFRKGDSFSGLGLNWPVAEKQCERYGLEIMPFFYV